MAEKDEVSCTSGPRLIFPCSGAADVGAIADQAARKLTREGSGKMFCTAGLGGKVEPILKGTQSASMIVALEGCSLDCVKQSLEEAGFSDYVQVRVTDLGLEKGRAPVSDENIAKVASFVKEKLH